MSTLDRLASIVQNIHGAMMNPDPQEGYQHLEAARVAAQELLDEATAEMDAMGAWLDRTEGGRLAQTEAA